MTVLIRMTDLKNNMFSIHHVSSLQIFLVVRARVLVRKEHQMDTYKSAPGFATDQFCDFGKSLPFMGFILLSGKQWSRIVTEGTFSLKLYRGQRQPAILFSDRTDCPQTWDKVNILCCQYSLLYYLNLHFTSCYQITNSSITL